MTTVPSACSRFDLSAAPMDGKLLISQKMHLSSRAVNSACELGPWTRVVETGL